MKGASDRKDFVEKVNMYDVVQKAMLCNKPSKALDLLKKYPIIDPSMNNNWVLRFACGWGYSDVVAHLLTDERINPSANGNEAIREASARGCARIVELLLKDGRADPTVDMRYPLRLASQNGHVEVVKLLLADPRINPPELNNPSIMLARRNGHTEIVELFQAYFKNFNSKRGNIDNMKNSNSAKMRCIKMWYPDQEYYVSRTVSADAEVTIKYIFELFDLDPSITTLAYRDADAQNVRLSLDNDADIDEFNSFVKDGFRDGVPLIMRPLKKRKAKPYAHTTRVNPCGQIPIWQICLSIFAMVFAMKIPFCPGCFIPFLVILYWVRKYHGNEFVRDFFDDKKRPAETVQPNEPNEYADELQKLHSLGFTKKSRNTKYLKKYNGDLHKTIAALLK
jgi:hypothetical protein